MPRFSNLLAWLSALALVALASACATQPALTDARRFARPAAAPALVIAHRGGALEAPENTLAALRHGVAAGAAWQEIDVHVTADDVAVLMHDGTVDRTTDGRGAVEAMTVAELRALSAGRAAFAPDVVARLRAEGIAPPEYGDRFAAERVPTLAEALAVPGVHLMIELKPTPHGERLVRAVLAAIEAQGAERRVALASFDPALLDLVRAAAPTLPLVGLVDHPSRLGPMIERRVAVLAVWHGLAREALEARAALSPPPAVWTWTIYGDARARDLDALGVDGLITDAPERVRKALVEGALPES